MMKYKQFILGELQETQIFSMLLSIFSRKKKMHFTKKVIVLLRWVVFCVYTKVQKSEASKRGHETMKNFNIGWIFKGKQKTGEEALWFEKH